MSTEHQGFSLIEIIISIAIFSIIAGGGLIGFIQVLGNNRQTGEIVTANRLAEEGLEAVRSIRNRDFNLLSSGTKGVGISDNLWSFSGTGDITDKYTRQIIITAANRDAGGTLVDSGSTDPDTFLVKSKITWNYSPGDPKQFSLDTVFTNWRKPIGINYDGLFIYGNSTVNTPFWRSYTISNNSVSAESALPNIIGNPRNFVVRTSPRKTEAVAGIASNSGTLYIYCFDGNNWTQDWSVTVGGTASTRRFDIAYETNSGNVVVLYSTNNTAANELNFRTKSGSNVCGSSNWAPAANFDPLRTSGTVQWVKMASDSRPGSNLIAAAWADSNSDLSAAVWNTVTFSNEPAAVTEASLDFVSASQDVDDFDLAYESVTADLMIIWANSAGKNGTNGVRYRLCTGANTTCSWTNATTPPTFSDDATNLDLSANPDSDEMVFASIGNAGSDLQIGYWSGVGWTNTANVDTSCEVPLAGTKIVATGWLSSGSAVRSVVAYNDNNTVNINWYVGNRGVFTGQSDIGVSPNFANPQKWYEISVNPKSKDQLMLILSDNASDLFAKKLAMNSVPTFVWTAPDGNTALELNLSQSTVKPFGFAWWQQ